jgi:hypothetical protein
MGASPVQYGAADAVGEERVDDGDATDKPSMFFSRRGRVGDLREAWPPALDAQAAAARARQGPSASAAEPPPEYAPRTPSLSALGQPDWSTLTWPGDGGQT